MSDETLLEPMMMMMVGEIASVKNTAHDFGQFTRIGDHIDEVSYGFNVMFVVDGEGQRFFGK